MNLDQALEAEQKVYERFSLSKSFGHNHRAFVTPGIKQFAHWNSVYSANSLTAEDKTLLRGLYKSHGVEGGCFQKCEKSTPDAVHYYYLDKHSHQPSHPKSGIQTATVAEQQDLNKFCGFMHKKFGFEDKTGEYFREKMELFYQEHSSVMLVAVGAGENTVGTVSAFEAGNGLSFIFNFGFDSPDAGSALLTEAVSGSSAEGLLLYVSNPQEEKLVQSAGFAYIGSTTREAL
jgi:hypothetical protein